jgi:hypothetical protein
MRAARFGFGAVVAAAGVSGVALLAFPSSTGDFFSWKLAPPPLASLIGGLYVASSVVFGMALVLPWRQVRSLVAASFVLTAPTFVATMVHLEVFDLHRWQAWFWLLLFGGAPWFWAGLLLTNRLPGDARPPARRWATLSIVALVLAAGAVAVWIDPVGASRVLPFDFSSMGGRFVGSWLAFASAMAAWAGLRPSEARLPLIALAAYPAGALAGGLRSVADLTAGRSVYLISLAGLSAIAAVAAVRARPATGARGS